MYLSKISSRNFIFRFFRSMDSAVEIMNIEKVASQSFSLINTLNIQLETLRQQAIEQKKEDLKKENEQLSSMLSQLTKKLVDLEKKRGEVQYYDFCKTGSAPQSPLARKVSSTSAPLGGAVVPETPNDSVFEEPAPAPSQEVKQEAPKKKKEKPAKKDGGAKKPVEEEIPVDVRRLDFRVGKIISAEKHPDAESLYVESIDCGEETPRTVVSGLVRFVPLEQMQNRMVVVLCNLKPAKMRGVTSQAMVMCASTPDKVEILTPPEGSSPGDLVEFEGFPRTPDGVLNPKKKIFEACAPDLKTNGNREAVYKDVAMTVPGKGAVVAETLAGVQVK